MPLNFVYETIQTQHYLKSYFLRELERLTLDRRIAERKRVGRRPTTGETNESCANELVIGDTKRKPSQ